MIPADLPASVLYLLVSSEIPEEAEEAIMGRVEAGDIIDDATT